MASGRQASIMPADSNPVGLYECPANRKAVATVRACNQTATEIRVWLWLGTATYSDADCIEPNTPIQGYTVLENSGLLMGAGDTLFVKTEGVGVNFILWALEELA